LDVKSWKDAGGKRPRAFFCQADKKKMKRTFNCGLFMHGMCYGEKEKRNNEGPHYASSG